MPQKNKIPNNWPRHGQWRRHLLSSARVSGARSCLRSSPHSLLVWPTNTYWWIYDSLRTRDVLLWLDAKVTACHCPVVCCPWSCFDCGEIKTCCLLLLVQCWCPWDYIHSQIKENLLAHHSLNCPNSNWVGDKKPCLIEWIHNDRIIPLIWTHKPTEHPFPISGHANFIGSNSPIQSSQMTIPIFSMSISDDDFCTWTPPGTRSDTHPCRYCTIRHSQLTGVATAALLDLHPIKVRNVGLFCGCRTGGTWSPRDTTKGWLLMVDIVSVTTSGLSCWLAGSLASVFIPTCEIGMGLLAVP